ncbi:phage portal protein [Streptomyces sp. DSM 42041]|uniref:Phage portal protein n=1 Tax=Streptomyces hazeniae TaxID=3075538 RepID=A0ABU2NNK9_9ACTN|nr:phage portal protein [Streptomyces sp. DSM 42041]MDT0377238.1 phage portal protein [Streptomyces sp. DSM 42041]
MKSPLAALGRFLVRNDAPVPYVPRAARTGPVMPYATRGGMEAQMRAMGTVGTLFAIVNRTSNATAQAEWRLYRRAPSGDPEDRREILSHPALDLWQRPNPFMPRQEFVEAFQQHIDLTGEGWWVLARNRRATMPLELWPVRPDRMEPVRHPELFLTGYVYTGPGGEQVPLGRRDVIQLRMPNPLDPYRGMGPVQTLLADLDGVRFSAEWNRNFFANSAEPGGIIEVPEGLLDEEFNELRDRWNEQHRGVANAHRVAILEHGKWVDRKYSHTDMQFTELRQLSREFIREAFGMPKPMLGTVEDANRANMEAAEVIFARYLVVPRLERIKSALNRELLPLFGTASAGLEFDYDNPVPADRELEARELEARARAVKDLVDAGAYGPQALEAVGLPAVAFGQPDADPDRELLIDLVKGAPAHLAELLLPALGFDLPAPAAESGGAPASSPPGTGNGGAGGETEGVEARWWPAASTPSTTWPPPGLTAARNNDGDENEEEGEEAEEAMDTVHRQHTEATTDLMDEWETVAEEQYQELAQQIQTAVDDEDPEALAELALSTDGTATLRRALGAMATTAAEQMAREADAQGVEVEPPDIDEALRNQMPVHVWAVFGVELVDIAAATAGLLASALAGQAGREALRRYRPGISGRQVAEEVTGWLRGLKHVLRRDTLADALHRAQNVGRLATLAEAPDPWRYVADERNDGNVCPPCREVDGTVFPDLEAARQVYGTGGYDQCAGGPRCRGTVRAIWNRPEDEEG